MPVLLRETISAAPTLRPPAPYPDAVTLREALQNPAACLTDAFDLSRAVVATDRFALPLAYTGRFAAVFRLTLPGGVVVALRVFTSADTSPSRDRDARSRVVSASLATLQGQIGDLLPPFLHVPDAVRVGDSRYAAQVLPWAEGEPLLSFVLRHFRDIAVLETLAQTVAAAVERLEAAGVTHGDLQHDNLLVRDSGRAITLVDYDALYTPDLSGFAPPTERGHANFQHVGRTPAHYGSPHGDRFASAVIRAGLLLVAASPDAWETFAGDTGEGMIFTATDFAHPSVSPVFDAAHRAAKHHPALSEALAELETLIREPFPQTRTVAVAAPSIPNTGKTKFSPTLHLTPAPPSRVTPTCAEEEPRPVSYLAPLRLPAFARQEAVHLLYLRGFLLLAPPTTGLLWLWAWSAGGEKWLFLACLFAVFTATLAAFLYLTWGAKKQHDALELEAGKLREAERLDREREKRLRRSIAQNAAPPEGWRERAHLRQTLSLIPLSRAIGDAGVSASVVRQLRESGITSAAHLWSRHGFLPGGTPPADAAMLRAWLADAEGREKQNFARENDPAQAAQETLSRIAAARSKRAARLTALARERQNFPDTTFAALLRRAVRPRTARVLTPNT